MKIYLSDEHSDTSNMTAWKKRISKCDVVILPYNYKQYKQCVADKGMAQALGKAIWYTSMYN